MIVVVPFPTEETWPAEDTVATDSSDVVHVTVGFEMTLPPASTPVATIVVVSPAKLKLKLVGDSDRDAATWLTVTLAVALTESEVAVIVAVPFATEVTSPAAETVATDSSDVVQATVASGIVLLFASLTVARSLTPSPIDEKLGTVSDNSMLAAV